MNFPLLVLILLGFVLTVWGSVSRMRDKCIPLSSWMIAAGLFLLILAVVSVLMQRQRVMATLQKAFWGGLSLFVTILLWLALCIAGSYLSLTAIQSGRSHLVEVPKQCDEPTVIAATACLVLDWIILLISGYKSLQTFISDAKNQDGRGQYSEELH